MAIQKINRPEIQPKTTAVAPAQPAVTAQPTQNAASTTSAKVSHDAFKTSTPPAAPPSTRDAALEAFVQKREKSTAVVSAAPAKIPATVKKGSQGPAVVELQQKLKSAGFNPGPADGDFGPKTDAAVRAYQKAHGLAVDGVVGPQTWTSLLNSQPAPAPAPSAPTGPAPSSGAIPATVKKGSHGPAVVELQQKLKSVGFNPGPADGDFGPQTDAAVRGFQQSRGLTVDGVVGPQTWGALLKASSGSGPAPTDSTGGVHGPVPKTGNAFIDQVAAGAVAGQNKWHIPASVSIAQAILESGWGKSKLATEANNLFGMKGTGTAGSYTIRTSEYVNGKWIWIDAAFKKFHNQGESIEEHARLLGTSRYYEKARQVASDPRAFAHALTGVYATAPNYGEALINVMDRYNLYQFDKVS